MRGSPERAAVASAPGSGARLSSRCSTNGSCSARTRSSAVTRPRGGPSPSTTHTSRAPASNMATSASPAIWSGASASTVGRRAALTGAPAPWPAASTRARRSASSTTPRPPGVATSAAVAPASVMSRAASPTVAPESTNSGGWVTSVPSFVVLSSGRPWARCPVRIMRSRRVSATKLVPSGWPSARSASARGRTRHTLGSCARTVNAGARPVSSEGWPKASPGSRTSTTWSPWSSSIEPVRTT